ncbi:MAG: GAF domain-containing protein [Bacteriovoracaceae bacterium]
MQRYHVKVLLREFEKRKVKNGRFSLRAFAKFLGFAPSTLSRILTNGQEISASATKTIMKKLQLNEEERMLFIASIAESKKLNTLRTLGKVPGDGFKDFLFTLDSVSNLAMKELADGCIIHLLGLKDEAIVHAKHKSSQFEGIKLDTMSTPAVCHPVLSPDKPLIINSKGKHDDILNHLNAHSILCLPVKKNERKLGSITLLRNKDRKNFSQDDLKPAEELAAKAAYVYTLISEH